MLRTSLTLTILLATSVSVGFADTIHVDAAAGDDAWSGLCPTWDGADCGPKATIQAAIDDAQDGDEVVVAGGLYTGEGNYDIDVIDKALVIRADGVAEDCVIDCAQLGRGFLLDGDKPVTLQSLTITNGVADDGAGVLSRADALVTLKQCRLIANVADDGLGEGGGLKCFGGETLLDDCLFRQNHAKHGGGAYVYGDTTVNGCVFADNHGVYGAGAISIYGPTDLIGCVLLRNTSKTAAPIGAWAQTRVIRCTLIDNVGSPANALVASSADTATVLGCILRDGGDELDTYSTGLLDVRFSNVEGGCPGQGNIDVDPQFVLPGDWRLAHDSPCIDAGLADPDGFLPVYDGDGDGAAIADMGADEHNPSAAAIASQPDDLCFAALIGEPNPEPQKLFLANAGGAPMDWTIASSAGWLSVAPDAGAEVGQADVLVDAAGLAVGDYAACLIITSSGAANSPVRIPVHLTVRTPRHVPGDYATIQEAVDAAEPGDHVIVADGVYSGEGNVYIQLRGKAITVRSQNGPESCTLDYDPGPYYGCIFFVHEGETNETVIEGFSLKHGSGIGALCEAGPTIRNCVFRGNHGSSLYCEGDVHVEDCIFVDCSSGLYGAGALLSGGEARFVNCLFSGNHAFYGGAAVFSEGGDHAFENCQFTQNDAGYYGAAVMFFDSSMAFVRCRFDGNTAGYADVIGGASGSVLKVIECEFTNSIIGVPPDGSAPGPLVSMNGNLVRVESCAFSNNTAGGVVLCRYEHQTRGVLQMRDTVFTGGCNSAITCWGSDAYVSNCTFQGVRSPEEGAALRLERVNAWVDNCLFAGNSAADGGVAYLQDAVLLRLANCTLADNNAAQGAAICSKSNGYAARVDLINSIVACGPDPISKDEGTLVLTKYSNIPGWSGEGCISADPLFVSPGHWNDNGTPEDETDDIWIDGDYSLQAGSPCIDAGNVFLVPRDADDLDNDGSSADPIPFDLAGMSRFHDDPATPDTGVGTFYYPAVDIGAYEFGAAAGPLGGPSFGDANCDNEVNAFDIDPFVLALVNPTEHQNAYPGCDIRNADCNGDGLVDAFDIDAFVKMLVGAL